LKRKTYFNRGCGLRAFAPSMGTTTASYITAKLLSENVNKTEKKRRTVGFYRDEFKRIRKIEK